MMEYILTFKQYMTLHIPVVQGVATVCVGRITFAMSGVWGVMTYFVGHQKQIRKTENKVSDIGVS